MEKALLFKLHLPLNTLGGQAYNEFGAFVLLAFKRYGAA